jgi:hypothetical protein
MSWFKRKKEVEVPLVPTPVTDSNDRAMIEIVANKQAKQEVIAQAKEANDHLQKLLEANHFTVTIYIAAGGKQRKVGAK